MNVLHLFTRRRLGSSALVLAATLTACSDTTAPEPIRPLASGYLTTSAAVLRSTNINFSTLYPGVGTQNATLRTTGDTTIQTFTVNPTAGSIVFLGGSFAKHVLAISRDALCDPTKNSYGPTEWLKPCTAATKPITFTVKTWKNAAGRPFADFQPAIRFSPDDDEAVRIYFQDTALRSYSEIYIPYCDKANVCVKEETTDAKLTTYAAPSVGGGYWVYRRLRHFSGYNVTAF